MALSAGFNIDIGDVASDFTALGDWTLVGFVTGTSVTITGADQSGSGPTATVTRVQAVRMNTDARVSVMDEHFRPVVDASLEMFDLNNQEQVLEVRQTNRNGEATFADPATNHPDTIPGFRPRVTRNSGKSGDMAQVGVKHIQIASTAFAETVDDSGLTEDISAGSYVHTLGVEGTWLVFVSGTLAA